MPGRTVLDASFHRNSGPARNLRPGKRTSRIDVLRTKQIAAFDASFGRGSGPTGAAKEGAESARSRRWSRCRQHIAEAWSSDSPGTSERHHGSALGEAHRRGISRFRAKQGFGIAILRAHPELQINPFFEPCRRRSLKDHAFRYAEWRSLCSGHRLPSRICLPGLCKRSRMAGSSPRRGTLPRGRPGLRSRDSRRRSAVSR